MSELSPIRVPPFAPRIQTGPSSAEGTGPSFGEVLKISLERIGQMQQEADRAIQDLVLGRSHDLAGTLIAVEKAKLAFQALLQVRNKLLEAYQEIMRMPV